MEWDAEELAQLILKYYTDQADAGERQIVDEFLSLPHHRDKVAEILSKEGFEKEKSLWDLAAEREMANRERILAVIEEHASETPILSHRRRFRRRLLAAASVILVLCSGYLLTRLFHFHNSTPASAAAVVDLQPGGQHATLTLSTGKKLILDSLSIGQIAMEAGSIVQKRNSGQLDYVSAAAKEDAGFASNVLTTPRGGMYQVLLPDQSVVVLNSESSLTYPTAFPAGGPRVVQLTGEAYFAIRHDSKRPFYVKVGSGLVQALGTTFNVDAYEDEPSVKTTLLDGLVRVVQASDSALLHPGQQATMKEGHLQVINAADTEAVVGWKNGDFVFNSTPLDEVMRQLGRWYDVQVEYDAQGAAPAFTADISRNRPASEVLKALEVSGYKFTIVGKDRIQAVRK